MTYRPAYFLPRLAVLATIVLATPGASCAQAPGNGGTTGGPPAPSAPAAVPLDGGASLLLASGVAYGLKLLRQGRAS